MKRKYLEEIGLKLEDTPIGCCLEESKNIEKGRGKRWFIERKKYGFDSRETWDLDYTIKLYLYERLCMYKEKLVLVEKEVQNLQSVIYKDKEYTHIEAIDFIIENFKLALLKDDLKFEKMNESEICKMINNAMELFCLIISDIEYIGMAIAINSKNKDINFEEELKIYGFNQKEVWFLVKNFKEFLYKRLTMYNEVTENIIDKSSRFHEIVFKKEIITFQEYIDMLLEGLELDTKCSDEEKNNLEIQEKVNIVFELLPCGIKHLWW